MSGEYVPEDCWACATENARQQFRETGRRRFSYLMYLCPECGSKRCAKASDHLDACDKGEGERALQKMRDEVQATRDARIASEAAEKALRDAANKWTQGAWANNLPPRDADRPALILGTSQRAGDFMRAEADRIAAERNAS